MRTGYPHAQTPEGNVGCEAPATDQFAPGRQGRNREQKGHGRHYDTGEKQTGLNPQGPARKHKCSTQENEKQRKSRVSAAQPIYGRQHEEHEQQPSQKKDEIVLRLRFSRPVTGAVRLGLAVLYHAVPAFRSSLWRVNVVEGRVNDR